MQWSKHLQHTSVDVKLKPMWTVVSNWQSLYTEYCFPRLCFSCCCIDTTQMIWEKCGYNFGKKCGYNFGRCATETIFLERILSLKCGEWRGGQFQMLIGFKAIRPDKSNLKQSRQTNQNWNRACIDPVVNPTPRIAWFVGHKKSPHCIIYSG